MYGVDKGQAIYVLISRYLGHLCATSTQFSLSTPSYTQLHCPTRDRARKLRRLLSCMTAECHLRLRVATLRDVLFQDSILNLSLFHFKKKTKVSSNTMFSTDGQDLEEFCIFVNVSPCAPFILQTNAGISKSGSQLVTQSCSPPQPCLPLSISAMTGALSLTACSRVPSPYSWHRRRRRRCCSAWKRR